jgi:CSLREA domain-containing protein
MQLAKPEARLFIPLILLLAAPASRAVTLTVDTASDADAADGFCSFREAILAANSDSARNECPAGSGADRIVFALAFPTSVDLTADLPAITATVAIRGPGADQLAIDGQDVHRIFDFESGSGGAWYLLEDLSVQHGFSDTGLAPSGGGAYVGPGDHAVLSRVVFSENTAANGGGGVVVDSTLGLVASAEITDCTLIANVSLGAAGGGGLLVADGSIVTLSGSAIVDNRAAASTGTGGGILVQRGVLFASSSTVSGNAANESGGGVVVANGADGATLSLVDSTISDNLADADGNLLGDGGGLLSIYSTFSTLSLELRNSIVAGNHDGGVLVHPDLSLSPALAIAATGFNLIGVNEGAVAQFPAGSPNADANFVGTAAAPADPRLQPLALNGGLTLSHRPVLDPASLTIDHGACPGSAVDQRGGGDAVTHTRRVDSAPVPDHPASDGCDIGAIERGATAKAAAGIFADGFELGHALRWTAEAG